MSQFELIYGGGDIIDLLEEMIEEARQGKLIGVALGQVTLGDDGGYEYHSGFAWKDDIQQPYAQMVTVTADMNYRLMKSGLESDV